MKKYKTKKHKIKWSYILKHKYKLKSKDAYMEKYIQTYITQRTHREHTHILSHQSPTTLTSPLSSQHTQIYIYTNKYRGEKKQRNDITIYMHTYTRIQTNANRCTDSHTYTHNYNYQQTPTKT